MSSYPYPQSALPPIADRDLPTPYSRGYATDENIAVRCSGDYAALVPDHQIVVRVDDGSIMAGMPWLVISATANFVTAGCQPGQVVHFDENEAEVYTPGGDYLVISTVSPQSLTLRRLGMLDGQGQRPGHGNLNPVHFTVRTFGPQIEEATFELNQRLQISPDSQFWNPDNLFDKRQLRSACVLTVLYRQYTSESRGDGDWERKRVEIEKQLDTALARLAVKWGRDGTSDLPTRTMQGRISR